MFSIGCKTTPVESTIVGFVVRCVLRPIVPMLCRASLDRIVKAAYSQAVRETESYMAAQMKDISELTSTFRCPRCGCALIHSDVRNLLEPEQFEHIDTLVSEVSVSATKHMLGRFFLRVG